MNINGMQAGWQYKILIDGHSMLIFSEIRLD